MAEAGPGPVGRGEDDGERVDAGATANGVAVNGVAVEVETEGPGPNAAAAAVAPDSSTAAASDNKGGEGEPQTEAADAAELLVHIQGIKFLHPEFGVGRIHAHVTSLGGDFAKVSAKRVRRVMKKHGLLQSQLDADCAKAGVLHLRTVGDSSKPHHAAPAPVLVGESCWKPVELAVPADRSGKRPHQATISSIAKAPAPTPVPAPAAGTTGSEAAPLGELFKVQIASGDGGGAPMLVYNETRGKMTYVHADDNPGYGAIRSLVELSGQMGTNGATGGLKAFLWGRHTRQTGRNFVLLNTEELAPTQPW